MYASLTLQLQLKLPFGGVHCHLTDANGEAIFLFGGNAHNLMTSLPLAAVFLSHAFS
jgi:hypothetical protein